MPAPPDVPYESVHTEPIAQLRETTRRVSIQCSHGAVHDQLDGFGERQLLG
jgi:hypothetical protein